MYEIKVVFYGWYTSNGIINFHIYINNMTQDGAELFHY